MIDPTTLAKCGVEYVASSGKRWVFVWTITSISEGEKKGLWAPGTGSYTNTMLLVWALLLERNPGITTQEVGAFMDAETREGKEDELDAACALAIERSGNKRILQLLKDAREKQAELDPS